MAAPTTNWSLPLYDGSEVSPLKTLLNALSNALEAALDNFKTKIGWGFLGPYSSLASLNAVTGDHVGQKATVAQSANAAENGDYIWSGARWFAATQSGNLTWATGSFTALSSQGSWPTSSGSATTGVGQLQTVTFATPFPSTPNLALTMNSGFISQDIPVTSSVSATGFSVAVIRSFNSGHTIGLNWVAFV